MSNNTKRSSDWSCTIKVPFPNEKTASIAYNTLVVDEEPKKSEVKKSLELNGSVLEVHLSATEGRLLRMASQSFLTFLHLTLQTMEMFPEHLA